jgi:hypothetical protein
MDSSGLEQDTVADSREYRNEPSGLAKGEEFLDQLSDC